MPPKKKLVQIFFSEIGPFKVEVISTSPYISIFHEILSEEEINWMIEFSIPRLSRSRDASVNGTENVGMIIII